MNPEQSNLRQRQHSEEESASAQVQAASQGERREFASVEDLLRYDSEQNPIPADVSKRLEKSLSTEGKPKPWYKKLFE